MKGSKKSKERPETLDEPQEFIRKISAKLRQLRQDRGYTSHETFAFMNDFDRTQWSKMERGVDMKVSSLYRAFKALKTTPEEFFKGFK